MTWEKGYAGNIVLTWCVALDVSHLDEPVGGLLHVVVAVGEDVQQEVLLYRREYALEVPVNQ